MDAGAHVAPVLTEDATRFIGPLTFSAVASEPARTSLWDSPEPIPHTRLGQTADLIVVAPATAGLLGSYAAGISHDLLTATLLATRAPVIVCPAMHTEMWEHAAVQENLATLRRRGVHIVEPAVGHLAGGDEGPGRLAEPVDIVSAVIELLANPSPSQDLAGLRLLITAGGTREPIDPVRFIGNRSSGKQGHALADEAASRGAAVRLVTTTNRPTPAGAEVIAVETAADMEAAVLARADDSDVVIMAAAVADFRPKAPADHKLKKTEGVPEVVLEQTPDILAELGRRRRPGQVLVGFAAETVFSRGSGQAGDLRAYAEQKLRGKHLDLVVANDVSAPGAGFEHDTNAVLVLGADGTAIEVPLADKRAIARTILDAVVTLLPRSHR
jgi:phosphopantothenoylcysteine decarboxylase/phosphopantothenate--cysteine ligase